jgi:hypothetical protein
VVVVADRVKTLAAQGSDGSCSGLGRMISSPQHLRLQSIEFGSGGMSSSLGWGEGFGQEFTGMYRMKRKKRSDAHDMMDITFKSIVHALRLSGIEILKMYFFLPNYQCLSVAVRKKMCMEARKKMRMTVRKNMCMTARKMRVAESKIIGMPTVTKRIKCKVIVDHLC